MISYICYHMCILYLLFLFNTFCCLFQYKFQFQMFFLSTRGGYNVNIWYRINMTCQILQLLLLSLLITRQDNELFYLEQLMSVYIGVYHWQRAGHGHASSMGFLSQHSVPSSQPYFCLYFIITASR